MNFSTNHNGYFGREFSRVFFSLESDDRNKDIIDVKEHVSAYKLKVEWNDDKIPSHMSLNIEGVTVHLRRIDSYEDLQ